MELPDVDTALAWRGRTVVDPQGEELGKVSALYLDADSQRPAWAGVKRGLLRGGETLVPLAGAQEDEDRVRIAYDRAKIEGAPDVDPDVELTEEQEQALHEHYGQAWAPAGGDRVAGVSDAPAATGSDDGSDGPGAVAAGDEADRDVGSDEREAGEEADAPVEVIRSEEEVVAGTRVNTRAERVRLRKVVVEDEVTRTVPVRKEVVQVETDPPPEGTIESVEDVDDQRS